MTQDAKAIFDELMLKNVFCNIIHRIIPDAFDDRVFGPSTLDRIIKPIPFSISSVPQPENAQSRVVMGYYQKHIFEIDYSGITLEPRGKILCARSSFL